tara:strand:+ start:2175 stop:2633 length:459 start_codon:yes stop_codon:yes gene_type:complete
MSDTNIQPSQKLDAVLNYLNENRQLAFHYGFGLPRHYGKPNQVIILTDDDILNVLDKLTRDNLVRVSKQGIGKGNPNSADHYAISLDGEVLLQEGGYTGRIESEKLKNTIQKQHLRVSQRNDRILAHTSIFAAVGAIGLLLIEFWKAFFPNL